MQTNEPDSHRALADIDLSELTFMMSSEDGGYYDPATGETYPIISGTIVAGDDDVDLDELDVIRVDNQSREGFDDMTDFARAVSDAVLSDQLFRSLDGRGPFRRFRNTLAEEGDAFREIWFRFSNARLEARAIEWLVDNDLCDTSEAAVAVQERDALAEAALAEAAGWIRHVP
jgi:hypothetical protein